jgi:hypothetical protein
MINRSGRMGWTHPELAIRTGKIMQLKTLADVRDFAG